MIKQADKKQPLKGDDCFTDSGGRIKAGVLDEHYISAALEYPFAKKIDLLRYAIESAEIGDRLTASYQRACEIHDRLLDKIDTAVIKLAKDARRMGLTTIMELCENAESEAVRSTMATTLTKDLFPNVSVKKTQTIDDLNGEISNLLKETAEAEGKSVDQVMKELIH